jgi:glycosyltransferase involved in cell wall biosynthesis
MSKGDIGIVPNLVPVKGLAKGLTTALSMKMRKEEDNDFLLRFKATSNAGRIFVFAQYGIPVVADMYPSVLQLIEDNVDGFICFSTEAWLSALRRLASSHALRTSIGAAMAEKFDKRFSPDVMNKGLIEFIKRL